MMKFMLEGEKESRPAKPSGIRISCPVMVHYKADSVSSSRGLCSGNQEEHLSGYFLVPVLGFPAGAFP